MILVRRDPSKIPAKLLQVAARAQAQLDAINDVEGRKKFIKKKSHIWRKFSLYLGEMHYGKCWYSESPDPQSFFDVDHFRPKLEAKRSDTETDKPGYEWLAFSWENFRYSAGCSNRVSQNHETGIVEGKGSWFPLLEHSPKADWNNRCESTERPLPLDPVNPADVRLLSIDSEGKVVPSKFAVGSARRRVERSRELYGLNLPRLVSARKRVMREITSMIDVLVDMAGAVEGQSTPIEVADRQPIEKQRDQISEKTCRSSPYTLAARAALVRAGYPELCA